MSYIRQHASERAFVDWMMIASNFTSDNTTMSQQIKQFVVTHRTKTLEHIRIARQRGKALIQHSPLTQEK